jgi:hypothetical protein
VYTRPVMVEAAIDLEMGKSLKRINALAFNLRGRSEWAGPGCQTDVGGDSEARHSGGIGSHGPISISERRRGHESEVIDLN